MKIFPGGTSWEWLISGIGEFEDFVGALWRALPYDKRGYWKQKSLPDMLRDLYRHIGDVDWTDAMANLVKEWYTDMVFGRMGRSLRDAIRNNPYYNRPVGLGTGPVH